MTGYDILWQTAIVTRNAIVLCLCIWAVMRLAIWVLDFFYDRDEEPPT
ncbi:hypothetical protein [Komagataeibacter melaceti]|nr:hypothetical protein [Komagataeibacter melaceti]